MINLTKLRRSGVWLLSLIAALFFLSDATKAATPGIRGEWPGHTANWSSDADYSNWTDEGNNWYSYNITPNSDGNIYFRIRFWNGSANKEYQPQSDSSNQVVVNGTPYNTWDKNDQAGTKAFEVSNAKSGKTYKAWFNTSSYQVKVTWDTSSSSGGDTTPTTPGLLGEGMTGLSWTNADYTGWSTDGDWYKKSITPTASGTIKFRIKYQDGDTLREYQPNADNKEQVVTNGTTYSSWGRGTTEGHNSSWNITATAGTEYTIWINTTTSTNNVKVTWSDTPPPPTASLTTITDYRLAGLDGKWGTAATAFPATGVITQSFTSAPTFKLYNEARTENSGYFTSSFYGAGIKASGDNFTLDGYDYSKSPEVTFTLTLNGSTPTLTATWESDNKGWTSVALIGEWLNKTDWSTGISDYTESEDGSEVTFKVKPKADGSAKFQIKVDGTRYWPSSNYTFTEKSNVWKTLTVTSENSQALQVAGVTADEITVNVKPATKEMNIYYENPKVNTTWYLRGDFDKTGSDWNTGIAFEGSGDTLTCSKTWTNTSWAFKVNDGNNSNPYYSDGSTMTRNSAATLNTNSGTMKLPASANGKEVTFTLTLSNGVPATLTANWDESNLATSIIGLESDAIEMSSSDSNKFTYTYAPTASGTKTFHIYDAKASANVGPTNNTTISFTSDSYVFQNCVANSNNWTLNVDNNYTYEFTYYNEYSSQHRLEIKRTYVGSGTPTGTYDYWMAAGFLNNWSKTDRLKFQVNPDNASEYIAKATYKESNSGNYGFKITTKESTDDGTWYSVGGTKLQNGTAVSIAGKTESANMVLNSTAIGKEVTFTLTLDANGKPSTIKAEWTEGGNSGIESNKVQILGNLTAAGVSQNSWTSGLNTVDAGGGYYTYTFTPTSNGTIYFGFSVDGTRYYPQWSGDCPGSSDDTSYNSIAYGTQKEAGSQWTYTVNSGKTYVITVNIASTNPARITIGEQQKMPVYPIGVYNDEQLLRYDEWPVLYILSGNLNNERITPEYQMNKVAEGKYELEFTMRNTWTRNSDYDSWSDRKISVVGFDNDTAGKKTLVSNVSVSLNKTENDKKDGAWYKATMEQQADKSWKLTLTELDKDMPFLSLIGKEWKQRIKVETPTSGQTTDNGWQEAWIQYDNRKQVVLDRNGKAMYNTLWPPRNPISFKTAFKVNGKEMDFTLGSESLTFKKVEKKTGAEWKADERFAKYAKDTFSESSPKETVGKLALIDNREYILYRVENVWINGDVKLWSGWNGFRFNSGLADWSEHSNWGHYGKSKNATGITAESTVQLANEDGDMAFSQPTFFQYVDFFYETSDPNAAGHSALFTELSVAGAQIEAMATGTNSSSTNKYEVGNFRPALNHLQGFSGGNLKEVVINSYATNNGVDEMVTNVFTWKASADQQVDNTDFYTLFKDLETHADLSGSGSYDETNFSSKGKWALDHYSYNTGDYFYKMRVVLTDDNGEEKSVTVSSNPFTIFKDKEEISVSVYQLVKVDEKIDDDGNVTSRYYTYKGSERDHTVPTTPVYELTIKNDDKYNAESNKVYDEEGNLVSYIDDTHYEFAYRVLDEIPDYGMTSEDVESNPNISRMQFTDKVLVVGSIPSASAVEGYAYGVGDRKAKANVGPMKAPITEQYDRSCMRPDMGNRFMHVTNVETFNEREFTLAMQYSSSFLDAEGKMQTITNAHTDPATANYILTVPEPVLKEAKVEVFYGDTDEEDTDNDIKSFTFRGHTFDARYHSVRDYIEVEYPNVSSYLKERLIKENFFSLQLSKTSEGEEDRTWDNVFEFKSDGTSDGVVVGPVMHPNVFNSTRTMKLVSDPAYTYYSRWQDGDITKIDATDNAPISFKHEVKNAYLYYNEDGDLISKFDIVVKHEDSYIPSDPSEDLSGAMSDKHNYIFHDGKDFFEHLRHHSDNDYYYVAVINKDLKNPDTVGDEDAIIDENGLTVKEYEQKKKDEETEEIIVTMPDNIPARMDAVVKATSLMNGNGYTFTVTKNFGHWYKGQLEAVQNEHFAKKLQVLVSYLYPFATDETAAAPADKKGLQRVVSDYSGDVLKSQANAMGFDGEIITSVTDINGENFGKVYAGTGFIYAEGTGVEIYAADGKKIAMGEGRHEVAAGVYMVRFNGRVQKVIVR